MLAIPEYVPTVDPTWLLEVAGFDPAREAQIEAVCAMVNGYLGVRAARDEGGPTARPATFIAGIFNTPAAPQAPELEAPIPELVVAPDWSQLRLSLDGAELSLERCELLEQRRCLDMRQGVFLRTWRLRDGQGRVTALASLRFASLADRRVLAQIVVVTPENYSGELSLETSVDARVLNENHTAHLLPLDQAPLPGAPLVLSTLEARYILAFAYRAEHQVAGIGPIAGAPFATAATRGQRFTWRAGPGQSATLRKVVAVATSRDGGDPQRSVELAAEAQFQRGMPTLLAEHSAAWADRWGAADIAIPGDEQLQRQSRFALYHLIGSANPADQRASIGARALTGERYRGHVFWDTEIFAWPPLLYTHPPTARALLMYRYHTLAGARAKAAAAGYRGALYPWESADSGEEVTPAFMLSGGRRVPVLTGSEEHHISADVALAVLQYVRATGDRAFLLAYGAEIVLDVARFWASRAEPSPAGLYHIRRVIGPDEYHESVDDNAYTNQLAAYILRRGHALAAELARDQPEQWAELAARLDLSPAELARWQRVAGGLRSGLDPATGLIEQFAGYHALAPIDLQGHDPSVATVDAQLGWYPMQQTRVLKQADVVMLLILLWEQFTPAVRAANFAYYEPQTSHDSSLSYSFHALCAARLGRLELAEDYLRRAGLIDLDLGRQGHAGASGGVHIAALGGLWQALVLGFLGVEPHDEGLRLDPHVPDHWGLVQAPISWRGALLRVSAAAGAPTSVTVATGGPVQIALGAGPWRELQNGATLQA